MQLQAWALLEQEDGNTGEARVLLEKASKVDPGHIPVWQAWGVLEFRAGNIETARALFQEVRLSHRGNQTMACNASQQ